MTETKLRKIPKKLFNEVEKIAESVGFDNVSISEYSNGNYFCFSYYSPAGQDFNFEVEAYTLKDLYSAVYDYYEAYDPSEETYLWLGEDGHGKNGAPYDIRDLVHDMEWCEEQIKALADAIYDIVYK